MTVEFFRIPHTVNIVRKTMLVNDNVMETEDQLYVFKIYLLFETFGNV